MESLYHRADFPFPEIGSAVELLFLDPAQMSIPDGVIYPAN